MTTILQIIKNQHVAVNWCDNMTCCSICSANSTVCSTVCSTETWDRDREERDRDRDRQSKTNRQRQTRTDRRSEGTSSELGRLWCLVVSCGLLTVRTSLSDPWFRRFRRPCYCFSQFYINFRRFRRPCHYFWTPDRITILKSRILLALPIVLYLVV